MKQGVCRTERADPNIFILEQGYTTSKAVSYCQRCSVRRQCEGYARRTGSVGVWGGKLFTIRESNPVELLPIMFIEDSRPRPANGNTVTLERRPGILGLPPKPHPGILGIPK